MMDELARLYLIDSGLPSGYPKKGGEVKDITGYTLWLLMQAINTENLTFVLDSCHSGGARKGLLTVRSRPGDRELVRTTDPTIQLLASPKEQEYQQQIISHLKLNPADLSTQRKSGVPKGVMLYAAQTEQEAFDAPFADISAGVFTYVLTRYLWQETGADAVNQVMVSTIDTTERILRDYFPTSSSVQKPDFNIKQGSDNGKQAVYFLSRRNIPAEAVVTKVQGNQIDLFLGGIDPRSLKAFGRGATFTVVDSQGQEQGQVQIESRQQLKAQGKFIEVNRGIIAAGTLLQERSRAIPSNLTLDIGLDPSLGQEIEQAKQALQSIKRIQPVPLSKQEVQYILGRITKSYYQQLQKLKVKNLPQVGSIALFSPAQDLIPGSAGTPTEKVTDAVKRLQAKFKSLLAARIVKLTLNTTSSRLAVSAAMQKVDGSQIVAESFTVRGGAKKIPTKTRGTTPQTSNAQKMQPGTEVQFLVANNEPRDLYISVLLISVDGELTVLSPLPGNEDVAPIAAKQEILIPDGDRGDKYTFKIGKDPGIAEVLVIASTTPLTRAIQLLRTLAAEKPEQRGNPVNLDKEPTEAIASLLDDLDEGSRGGGTNAIPDIRQIDTRQMAALSITFEVIA